MAFVEPRMRRSVAEMTVRPAPADRPVPALDRRTLLRWGAGAMLGGPLVISACSGSGSSGGSSGLPADVQLATRWIPTELGSGVVRLPVSFSTTEGMLDPGPDQVSADVLRYDSGEQIARLSAARSSLGADTVPFWVFRVELDEPGLYSLRVDGGPRDGATFQLLEPDQFYVPRIGEKMPAFDTPTFADSRGVDPLCSREPEPCPFHEVTLTEAMASGRPVIYVVGTPAHCSTGVCGPVLEQIIGATDLVERAVVVHADVYTDDSATKVAPAVEAAKLTFEPVAFVIDTTGTIVERLDAVWSVDELRVAVDPLVS